VEIRYNQNGSSRGIADITFFKPEAATKAAKELNGMLVDKRPMKATLYLIYFQDRLLNIC
jgi:THO complex subunit 4